MTLRFLADTNVLSELARPSPDPTLTQRLTAAAGSLALAAPTWHELWFGVDRLAPSRRKTSLAMFLSELEATLPVLPYDAAAATWHARERARLEAKGKTAPFVDGQIAAIAATRGLTLVTRNVRDFAPFEGVSLERW